MKVWTVTTNDNTDVFNNPEDADFAASEWATETWKEYMETPPPADWRKAYEQLENRALMFMDTIAVKEHDVSDHPFVLAIENLLDRGDIFVSSEVGDAIMAITNGDYSVPAEEQINCMSCGETTTLGESPPDCYDREHG